MACYLRKFLRFLLFSSFLFLTFPHGGASLREQHYRPSVDYSIQSLQKCRENKIPVSVHHVIVPPHRMSSMEEFRFRLTEKCATMLPHCVDTQCHNPTTVVIKLGASNTENLAEQGSTNTSADATNAGSYDHEDGDVGVNSTSSDYYAVDEEPTVLFTPKGYLRLEDEYFSVDDFCVYAFENTDIAVQVCPSQCAGGGGSDELHTYVASSESPIAPPPEKDPVVVVRSNERFEVCVPKCCSLHKVIDARTKSCEPTPKNVVPWAPLVYQSSSRQICGEKRANLKFHYSQRPPGCESFQAYFLKTVDEQTTRVRFRLLTNGSLVLKELYGDTWYTLQDGSFCLDGVVGSGGSDGGERGEYSGDPTDQVLIVCETQAYGWSGGRWGNSSEQEKRLTPSGIAYVVLLFSGIPFLFVTCLFYVLVLGQQNVHGWTLFSHTLAVLLHYLAQAVANFVSRILSSYYNASTVCAVVGVLNHFFVLAAFLWLTVINYDLFSMFRHLKTTVGRSRGMKRFIAYSAVAWGIPFAVVLVSVVLDQMYGLYGDDGDCQVDVVVPLYGHKSCYMVADARPLYLYYPVAAIMVVNLGLAGCTVVNMHKHDNESRNAHGEFSKRNTKHRKKFLVMAKLFVVMGVVWVFELFVWSFIQQGQVLPWYLVFPDLFNLFQAVAIFFLFACQPKLLGQVADKFPAFRGFTDLLLKLNCGKRSTDNTNSGRSGGGGGVSGGGSTSSTGRAANRNVVLDAKV